MRERARLDARRPRPSRPGRGGLYSDAHARPRPSPPEHRRSARRAAAAVERGRQRSGSSSTARSTTTPTSGASSKRTATATGRKSDTETIVHAYEQWGDDCVHRFRGMFAFAIWDAPKRRLLLVRDRLGVKPLYWARAGDTLLFGSEIKAHPRERPGRAAAERGRAARSAQHALHVRRPRRCFEGIYKLLPGHLLVFEDGDGHDRAVLGRADCDRSSTTERRAARPQRRRRRAIPRRCSRNRSVCG